MEKGLIKMGKKYIVNLGAVADIPLGQGVCVIIEDEEIAVFRTRTGEVFAVDNQCPHRRGPLSEGIVGDGKVICPLHGHKFDLRTGKGSEGQECLKVFLTWEDKGDVLMEWIPSYKTTEETKPCLLLN